MTTVTCLIVRWVDDEPFPGWVEGRLTDFHGREWVFFDKPPIFSSEDILRTSAFPRPGELRCHVLKRWITDDGAECAEIQLVEVDSADGESRFEVRAADLSG